MQVTLYDLYWQLVTVHPAPAAKELPEFETGSAFLSHLCWQLVTVHPAEVAPHVWRAPGVVQELPDGARKPILEPPSKASLCSEG